MMKRIYIAQLKCPSNHCVVALAGEYETYEDASVELNYRLGLVFGSAVKNKILKYECGICHATNLRVEMGLTKFRTMAEAEPALKQSAADQAASAEYLKRARN